MSVRSQTYFSERIGQIKPGEFFLSSSFFLAGWLFHGKLKEFFYLLKMTGTISVDFGARFGLEAHNGP